MKEIIFVGRSNVGKSTLISTLTGAKLRTGRRPGVTR
ncbi:MAG: 50S ribosome-binding GTPase, partial [Euryarchaeota archaeon]|nr:50S ribosome-binding GTPase [Euryarchaeota archaeon]